MITPKGASTAPRVIDLLLKPELWNETPMADPIEGPGYGPQTAEFFANVSERGGVPIINSHAHDGILYRLTFGLDEQANGIVSGCSLTETGQAFQWDHKDLASVMRRLASTPFEPDRQDSDRALYEAKERSIARRRAALGSFIRFKVGGDGKVYDTGEKLSQEEIDASVN